MIRVWRVGLLLLLLSLSGCFARKVASPLLMTSEHPEITAKLKNAVLAVESPMKEFNKYRVDDVIVDLRKTGLFQEVGYRDKLKGSPELLLTSLEIDETDFMEACSLGFEGEMITIGSIGVIPQICHSYHVITFELSRVGKEGKVDIRVAYEMGSVMGWVALAYNLSPEWTWMPQPQEKKLIQVWKAAFWQKADEILEILR